MRERETSFETAKQPFWRRHRWLKWFLGIALLFLIALGIAISMALHRAEPFLRALIVARLQDHFHARVELDSFHVSLMHGLRAQGKGLRIWPPARVAGLETDSSAPPKPLIDLAEFRFHAPLHYKAGQPIHIYRVELHGLRIDVPPRPRFTHQNEPSSTGEEPGLPGSGMFHFKIDNIVCSDAQLTLETSNPAKQPLVFALRTIKLQHVGPSGKMGFEAELTNPRPAGLILTKGDFGPWVVEDPGLTPIDGEYKFKHADLSVFKGISGTLSSNGNYRGTLRDMDIQGHTETPNFALTHYGTTLPLTTDFRARVDGTNGDTWLDQVDATLGSSHFSTSGKIVQVIESRDSSRKPAPPHAVGHEIALNTTVQQGQMADFMRLTSRTGDPMLTGTLHLKASIEIPPGTNPVHERMRLKGNFLLDSAQFTSPKIQQRIDELSLRGQGKPGEVKQPQTEDVRSSMAGDFTLDDGVLTLPNLVYSVPGAEIDLNGTYAVDGGGLSFYGTAKMQATVSQMVGGWKGLLLKPADRFFKKDGAGTKVKVHVDGTRDAPHFGIDF